jgi:hypothetical protein
MSAQRSLVKFQFFKGVTTPDPIRSQINRVHVLPAHFCNNPYNIILPYTPRSSKLSPSPSKLCKRFPCPPRSTCPAPRIVLDFITLVIYGEEHITWSCSLRSLPVSCYVPRLRPQAHSVIFAYSQVPLSCFASVEFGLPDTGSTVDSRINGPLMYGFRK